MEVEAEREAVKATSSSKATLFLCYPLISLIVFQDCEEK